MSEQAKTCSLSSLIDTVKRCSDAGERFCFILGAGTSVSSGIDSGTKMARQWLEELKKFEPEIIEGLIKENGIDENNIGSHYSKIYEIRFSKHPLHGYIWLQNAMKNAKPGLGYYHLAKILATDKTSINLVITTNFDSLTEDAIFMYTDKKPLVVTHELLAQYMDFLANRPIIAKIHRDLMLRPKNMKNELSKLSESWEQVLKKALGIYTPIVIGYGGNDESLMGLLEKVVNENGMEKPIYWCHQHDAHPKNERIIKLLNKCGGFLVPISDFDTAMYLFGEKFEHEFSEDKLKKQIQNRIDDYKKKREDIIDNLRNEQKRRKLFDDEKAVVDAISEAYKTKINELTEKINKNPNDANLYYNRGLKYNALKEYEKAIADKTMAIQLDPENAKYYNSRGISYSWLRMYEEAVEDHSSAIDKDSKKAVYYNNRGVCYNWLNKIEEAIEDYSKAIKFAPNRAKYYKSRGVCYMYLRENEKALDNYSKAVELDPENGYYYAGLGYALFKTNKVDNAFDALNKAIELDKYEALCYSNRGLISLKIAKINETECNPDVLDDFDKAFKLEEENRYFRCYTDYAEYYLYIGENETAYDNLKKALEINTRYGRAWYYLAKYYEAMKNNKEYENCIAKSKEYRFIPDKDD